MSVWGAREQVGVWVRTDCDGGVNIVKVDHSIKSSLWIKIQLTQSVSVITVIRLQNIHTIMCLSKKRMLEKRVIKKLSYK